MSMKEKGRRELELAYDGLEKEAPDRVSRAIHWLRDPKSRRIRLPLGIVLILASFGWILPVLGLELLPIGLLLIAQDVPILRKPVACLMLALEARWARLKGWWRQRKKAG